METKFYKRENIPSWILTIFIFSLLIIGISSCAKIGTPTGGAYDRTPPKLLDAKPKINSTNFKEKGFEVAFDEYIELSNSQEELIISPPFKEKPSIKAHLNKLKVSWDDTLAANITYIFDFGSSIVDYTEGNKLNNFVYSFSTGSFIDTMEYNGKVIEAYSLKPVARKYVMLYKSKERDIVSKEKPNYLTRTDSSGYFKFQNIAQGSYQILVLDDKNQNLLYDLPTEAIAFSKEKINATLYMRDTSRVKDSISLKDTIKKPLTTPSNTLYFYEPKDTRINLSSSNLISPYHIKLCFSNPTTDSLNFIFAYPKLIGKTDKNIFLQFNNTKDSIDIWSLGQRFDSVKFSVIDVDLKEDVELYNSRKVKEQIKDTFSFMAPKQDLAYFSECLLEMPFPINNDTISFEAMVIKEKDTTKIKCKPSLKSPLFIQVGEKFEQGSKQQIKIKEGSIRNKLGQVNDSINFYLTVDNENDYGNFFFSVEDTLLRNNNYILILEDMQGKELMTLYSKNKERIKFPNLKEGGYRLKIIIDSNNNKKWDYGNYNLNILPEEVIYFTKPINIRKNWDIEEVFIP